MEKKSREAGLVIYPKWWYFLDLLQWIYKDTVFIGKERRAYPGKMDDRSV